jgi:hypothetical protein
MRTEYLVMPGRILLCPRYVMSGRLAHAPSKQSKANLVADDGFFSEISRRA